MTKISDIKQITPGMSTFKVQIIRSQTSVKMPATSKADESAESEIVSSS